MCNNVRGKEGEKEEEEEEKDRVSVRLQEKRTQLI